MPDTRSPKFWRVTLPIGFAHPMLGSNSLSRARKRAGETRRVAAPSRPVPKNSGRRGGAFLIFPCGKGITRRNFGFSRPGAGKRNRGKFGPNMVPLRRNSERIYCIEIEVDSQGENSRSGLIYRLSNQLFTRRCGRERTLFQEPRNGRKASALKLLLSLRFPNASPRSQRRSDARAAIKCAWASRRSGSGRFHRPSGGAARRIVRLLAQS